MSKTELYIGLGSLLYALAKIDGRLQPEEFTTVEQILQQELEGEIALYAFQLREEYNSSPESAYGFALRLFRANKHDLDAETKKKFMAILQQVALAYDGLSRKERDLLKRCRRDLAKIR